MWWIFGWLAGSVLRAAVRDHQKAKARESRGSWIQKELQARQLAQMTPEQRRIWERQHGAGGAGKGGRVFLYAGIGVASLLVVSSISNSAGAPATVVLFGFAFLGVRWFLRRGGPPKSSPELTPVAVAAASPATVIDTPAL